MRKWLTATWQILVLSYDYGDVFFFPALTYKFNKPQLVSHKEPIASWLKTIVSHILLRFLSQILVWWFGDSYIIQCGNYLWNKFSNFKTNDICGKRWNRSIFVFNNAYFKLLQLFMTSSPMFLNDNPHFFLLFLIDLPTT
jgi:hypothetical protein